MHREMPEFGPEDIQGSIKGWLEARQKMMIAFNHLCMLKPFDDLTQEDLIEPVEDFCTELVDYLSYGQFKVFEKILSLTFPNRNESKDVKILLSRIFSSTIHSIEFHDTYTRNFEVDSLKKDLSDLGVHLAHRLDWEDQLLDNLYESVLMPHPPKTT